MGTETIWGHPHWCREINNAWQRCLNQDPAAAQVSPHCWKHVLDFQECLQQYKKKGAQTRASALWEEYLKRKYLGILPSQQYGGPNPNTAKAVWYGPQYEGYEHQYPNRNKGKYSDKW